MIIKEIAKLAVSAYTEFSETLWQKAKEQEAENRIAALSSFEFVFAFRGIVKEYAKTFYVQYCEEAAAMLAKGDDPADVLYRFESMIQKRKDG